MSNIYDALTNRCLEGWATFFVTFFALLISLVFNIIGDKSARLQKSRLIYELQNLSFNFLVFVFGSFGISSDNTRVLSGGLCEFDEKVKEITKIASGLGFFQRRKYISYIKFAEKYYESWNILSCKKSNKDIEKVITMQKQIMKKIQWLGKKTGRINEARKIQNNYNSWGLFF